MSIDGNFDAVFSHKSCSATNDQGGDPNWWMVDLGQPYPIHHVVLTNRNDNSGES